MSGINVKLGATDAGFTSTINKVKDSTKSLDTTVEKTDPGIPGLKKQAAPSGMLRYATISQA